MTNFDLSRLPEPQPAPPIDPAVAREEKIANDTRVESELNRFIASKQDALFNNPDAFYRTQGSDAIHAAPVATRNLEQLRNDLLDGLANDYQRKRLGAALDAQMQLTRQQMARHVSEQSLVWQRGVAQDRIDLLAKEAAYHHNDDYMIDGLGAAAANAARAHARVGDGPVDTDRENAAAATARSRIVSSAIQARLDKGQTQGAVALFDRVQDQLDPAHAAPLEAQIQTAQQPPEPKEGNIYQIVPAWPVGPDETDPPPPAPDPNPGDSTEPSGPSASEPEPGSGADDPERLPDPSVVEKLPVGSITAPTIGVPKVPTGPLPATVAQRLATTLAAGAPGAAGTAALASAAAAGVMLIPANSQGGTIELGDGLRAQWRPGQRTATIERRTSKGLFGSEVGANWEKLPVDATYEAGPDGRPTLFVDPQALKTALAAPANRVLSKSGIAPPYQALPMAKPQIYEIRIGVSANGGISTKLREATDEEVAKYCPNYPRYQEIASRASEAVRALGLPNGMPYGNLIHKMAEAEVTEISLARDMLRR